MVRLTKIYTRTGDDGTTGLGTGGRASKASARVEAYGTVDEANAALGLAVCAAESAGASGAEIAEVLRSIQQDLFDVGADLCTPVEAGEKPGARLRILPAQTDRLEPIIDRFNERLGPLTSFVLPGGTPLAAALHLARTITRRAERLTVLLREREPAATGPEPVRYLNRLSDLLFVLARAANRVAGGPGDVLWKPGANRGT
jgi:cob(I)alamin adenosyltransferase